MIPAGKLPRSDSFLARRPRIYPSFDHVVPSSKSEAPLVILYADVTSTNFPSFHRALMAASKKHGIGYVLRWKPSVPATSTSNKLFLNGYGVELALKSTEYKVTDDQKISAQGDGSEDGEGASLSDVFFGFDFKALAEKYPAAEVEAFKQLLLSQADEIATVKPVNASDLAGKSDHLGNRAQRSHVSGIDLKLTSFILASPFPMVTLRRMMEDFPRFASFLCGQDVKEEVRKEVQSNQPLASINQMMWINGLELAFESLDLFRYSKRKDLSVTN